MKPEGKNIKEQFELFADYGYFVFKCISIACKYEWDIFEKDS